MKRSVEVNEWRQQVFANEATIKRLNDELRDMENELNMARSMTPKTNEADEKKIEELESRLAAKENEHASKVEELQVKLDTMGKKF